MNRRNIIFALIIASLCFTSIRKLKAEIITFYPTQVLGHGTAPEGQPPWIAATFDDHGGQGSVTLTLECVNLTGDEFVSKWLFNLDPDLNPRDLEFDSLVKSGSFYTPDIDTRTNWYHGGGGDKFDISFSFSTSNRHSRRFDGHDTLQLEISGICTLTAASFDFDSTGKTSCDGILPTRTEAHIQGIGDCRDDSAWIVTPEPNSLVLIGCGLLGMTVFWLRKKKV